MVRIRAIPILPFNIAIIVLFAIGGGLAAAQEMHGYEIVQGDEVAVSYIGSSDPIAIRVDIDGEIRMNDVGGIRIAGLTLNEAEIEVEKRLSQAGLFVDPAANLRILEYAPVMIIGDVTSPGRYDYVPGMTVSAGLGLAGGGQRAGISQYEIERARIQVEGDLETLSLEIVGTVMRISRLQAIIDDADDVIPSPKLLERIPDRNIPDMDRLLSAEQEIFRADRSRRADLLAFWATEIESIESQRALFEQRIVQQERILESTATDLEVARDLERRGLQTNARIRDANQRDADARSRMIEMQSALVQAARSISDAARARAQFLANRQEEALLELRAARETLEVTIARYRKVQDHQTLLFGGLSGLVGSDLLTLSFNLISSRANRQDSGAIDIETPLLPGDTLIVRIDAAG